MAAATAAASNESGEDVLLLRAARYAESDAMARVELSEYAIACTAPPTPQQ